MALESESIQSTSATELLNLVPIGSRPAAPEAYNDSLRVCFQVGLIIACLAIPGALAMELGPYQKEPTPESA